MLRRAAVAVALVAFGCDDWDSLWENWDPDRSGINTAFLTSVEVVPGELGGIEGADAVCQERAEAAGLPLTFVAWLSTSTVDASSRLGSARGWLRTDGRPFTTSLSALTGIGQVLYPLRVDESGVLVSGRIVKGATGSRWGERTDDTAGDWSSTSSSFSAGDAMSTLFWEWGYFEDGSTAVRLYCFSIDGEDPREPAELPGRVAFVSREPFSPSTLAAADAHCQGEADAGGRSGSYLALLSTSETAAAARFDLEGLPWLRTDGIPWVDEAADLATNEPLTSLSVDSLGVYQSEGRHAWTGSLLPELVTTAGSQNCNDWSATGTGIVGGIDQTNELWWEWETEDCRGSAHLYCLEE